MERSTKERIEGPGPSEEGITNMYRCRGGCTREEGEGEMEGE